MLRTLGAQHQVQQLEENNPTLFRSDVRPVFLPLVSPEKQPSQQDIQQCAQLMEKMIESQSQLQNKASQILQEVSQRNYKKGLGYYNSKNLLLLEYLIQLQFYQLFKINGEELTEGEGLELYKRLAYLKTLLTKLSPVQKKLEYQKNKLLKYSDVVKVKPEVQKRKTKDQEEHIYEDQEVQEQQQEDDGHEEGDEASKAEVQKQESGEEDALNYQPRPEALMVVKQKKQKQQLHQGKYVAPKISAVLSKQDKRTRKLQIQEQRKKAFLIRKFRGDLEDDEDAREVGVGNEVAEKIKRKFQEKIAVEEENFMRMPESKQQKYWRKSLIRQQQKSNPLQQEFKDIQAIKQIFTQKQRPSPVIKLLKRRAPTQKVNSGKKKVKRN